MGFFKKEETQTMINDRITNEDIIKNDNTINNKSKRVLSLFKADTIEYIIKNFPTMSDELQKGLLDLSVILENTIDHIEDKSSKLIKDNRDFKLSQEYRDTCISVYEVVENIKDYVQWMKDKGNKNTEIKQEKKEDIKKDNLYPAEENEIKSKEISDTDVNTVNIELEVYKDFSGKDPKGFEIDNNIIIVEDWDDLLVKTAEILTKQYKENRHSTIEVKPVKVVDKKSPQNEFRNTVIEMLNEYKINLRDFKIIVK